MLPTPPASPILNGICSPEDRLGHILADCLQLTGILGVGAYGVVYTAQDIHTNTQYAVKALNKIGLNSRQRSFQQREIALHHEASRHPNVVSMVKIMESPDCTYVVLEYCPEGDLFSNITEKGHYIGNDWLAKSIFLQVLDAVEYCHSIGIYHRDLKPENILVRDQGMTAKLADFGLATTETLSSDFGCGSTFYMSPECNQQSPRPFSCYSSAPNDVWSLGVVLVNLACGRNPWKKASMDDSTFNAFLRDSEFLKTILPITDDFDCILRRIFECDPTKRINIPELRNMIIRCPAFTTTSSFTPSIPAPPVQPGTYQCVPTFNYQELDSFQLSPGTQTPATGFPQNINEPCFEQYHQSTSTRTSTSDDDADSVFSYDSASSNMPAGQPYFSKNSLPEFVPSKHSTQCHYISPTPSSSWYSNFIPALDMAQKHMNIQPFLSGVRVF